MFTPDLKEKQMKEYSFWYSETYTFKGWFEAESLEQARELLDQVQLAEVDLTDLVGFGFKDKAFDLEVDLSSVEDVSE
jgi:hypothetical protein